MHILLLPLFQVLVVAYLPTLLIVMNDVVTSYASSCIVTKAVYKKEYREKSRPECAYALRIGDEP